MGRPILNRHVQFTAEGEEVVQQAPAQIYSAERIVYLSGEVTEHLVSQVIAGMISLATHDPKTPIKLIISTYGGSVDEMFSLYDTIRYLPCPVHTVGMGKIMSAGVLLLASGEKGQRLIGENARVMIHGISGVVGGTFYQVKNETSEHERQQKQMEKLLMRETKMSQKYIDSVMKGNTDVYLQPDDALRLGIVDQVIGSAKK